MCGICGIYSFEADPRIDGALLERMTDSLVHRGPDEAGYFVDRAIGLGHRRLSIIDVAAGQQPIFNEDRTCCIIFNGEIYNYQPLREFLLGKGHLFQTQSDTEVILHLYEELGEACVEQLRGMFAFAIWDQSRRALFLARDRLGVKPLYYSLHQGRCVFGSEIKAIVCDPSIPREIDLQATDQYFSLLYIPAPRTIFRHIHKLPPAHTLTVTKEGARLREYWDVRFEPEMHSGASEEALCQQLGELLSEAVKIRLVSEVPLGAFLSGGIDSATVVALMAKAGSDPVNTCAIGFREDQFNELPYARLVANHHKTNHHEYVVDPQIAEVLEKLSWHFDEPFADASAVPTYYVSKMARERVTVALSGDGGDENFAGYRRYYFDRLENRLREYLPAWLSPAVRTAASLYPKADWLPRPFRAKTLLNNLSLSPVEGYFNSVSSIGDTVKQRLYSRDYLAVLNGHDRAIDLFRRYFQKAANADPLSTIQYVDIKTYLVDDICAKVDRASMASSLEVRSPFLDHKLVEFAAAIPWQFKLRGRIGKYILKETVKHVLPEEVVHRRKMGFSIPVRQWLRRELSTFCREHLESLGRRRPELFDAGFMRRLHSEHDSGLRDHSTVLWSLLAFELWEQRFMSPAARLP